MDQKGTCIERITPRDGLTEETLLKAAMTGTRDKGGRSARFRARQMSFDDDWPSYVCNRSYDQVCLEA